MNSDYYRNFVETATSVIDGNTSPAGFALKENAEMPFVDGEGTLQRFSAALQNTLENIDEELLKFEAHFSCKNNTVFWASSYNDVFDNLKKLFKIKKTKSVRLPNINNSTIFKELGIKYFLRDEKMTLSDDSEMQFFAVDMMFSDSGTLLLLNQTNTTLEKLTNGKINVFFATIDRVVSSSSWMEVIQQVKSYANGGGRQDAVLFKNSPNCENYLFVIDNQRSCLMEHKTLRRALNCLDCGRCRDVCPVFQTVGETPYNNVFAGPVANITLPFLETYETYMHVPYACTMCGRCEEVCPLSLPIRDMNLEVRRHFLDEEVIDKKERRAIATLRKFVGSRAKMNKPGFVRSYLFRKYLSPEVRRSRRIPPFSKETFAKYFSKLDEQ